MSREALEIRMMGRPLIAASIRDKLLLLLMKALMGASYTAGF